jgi:hypothetical protein
VNNALGILVESSVRQSLITNSNYSKSQVRGEKIESLHDLATTICRREVLPVQTSTSVSSEEWQSSGLFQTCEGTPEEIYCARFVLASEAYRSVDSFAAAITTAQSGKIWPGEVEQRMERLRECCKHRTEAISKSQKEIRYDTRLKAFHFLQRFYSGHMQLAEFGTHNLGLMIYWWLQNKEDLDVKDVVEFDCRCKLLFYETFPGGGSVRVEVDEIKTSGSLAYRGKNRCVARLIFLSGAIRSVYSVTNVRLRGNVFLARPLSYGTKKMQILHINGFEISIKYVDGILTLNRGSDNDI